MIHSAARYIESSMYKEILRVGDPSKFWGHSLFACQVSLVEKRPHNDSWAFLQQYNNNHRPGLDVADRITSFITICMVTVYHDRHIF